MGVFLGVMIQSKSIKITAEKRAFGHAWQRSRNLVCISVAIRAHKRRSPAKCFGRCFSPKAGSWKLVAAFLHKQLRELPSQRLYLWPVANLDVRISRILERVVLMVLFRAVEPLQWNNLGDDWA